MLSKPSLYLSSVAPSHFHSVSSPLHACHDTLSCLLSMTPPHWPTPSSSQRLRPLPCYGCRAQWPQPLSLWAGRIGDWLYMGEEELDIVRIWLQDVGCGWIQWRSVVGGARTNPIKSIMVVADPDKRWAAVHKSSYGRSWATGRLIAARARYLWSSPHWPPPLFCLFFKYFHVVVSDDVIWTATRHGLLVAVPQVAIGLGPSQWRGLSGGFKNCDWKPLWAVTKGSVYSSYVF